MDGLSLRIAGLFALAAVGLCGLLAWGGDATAPRERPAAAPAAVRTETHEVRVDGVVRRYLLHRPADHVAPAPLVVAFHGLESSAAQQERLSGLSVLAAAHGVVVAYPEGIDRRWAVGTRAQGAAEIGFVRVMIEDIARRHPIDRAHIHATGISNGAQMAMRLACAAPDLVASVATVAGGYPARADCPAGPPRAALVFHGTEDRVLPYGGRGALLMPVRGWVEYWAARNGCAALPARLSTAADVLVEVWSHCRDGADVALYTIEGGGHTWPGSATMPGRVTRTISASALMLEFFAAHPRR